MIPHKVQENGFEVRTFMPKYGCINERRNQLHEVIRLSGMNLQVDDTDHPLIIKVATLQASRNDEYFQHHAVKDLEIRETPEENDERLIFFVRGVMETVKKLRWEPAVMHCSGWVTSLSPMYIKKTYADDPTIGPSKIVYSIFDDTFEGTLDPRFVEKLKMDGFTDEDIEPLGNGPVDCIALHKLAIKSLGKPFLPYAGEEIDAPAIVEFYKNL